MAIVKDFIPEKRTMILAGKEIDMLSENMLKDFDSMFRILCLASDKYGIEISIPKSILMSTSMNIDYSSAARPYESSISRASAGFSKDNYTSRTKDPMNYLYPETSGQINILRPRQESSTGHSRLDSLPQDRLQDIFILNRPSMSSNTDQQTPEDKLIGSLLVK